MPSESVQTSGTSSTVVEGRGKSTIEFPYLDLDNAVEIAKAVFDLQGDRCEWNQLATKLGVAPEGGGFRMRMLTAKTFGLLSYERGQITLTELGLYVSDVPHERKARYDAFMAVPLFKKLFDDLNGRPLPPVAAIERIIQSAGAAPKQKEKARQVFQRSAKQAGLFELAPDRLSTPPGLTVAGTTGKHEQFTSSDKEKPRTDVERSGRVAGAGAGAGGGGSDDLHPFIQGLLQKLPPTDSVWAVEARAKWLTTASNIFDLMYKADDENVQFITVAVNHL